MAELWWIPGAVVLEWIFELFISSFLFIIANLTELLVTVGGKE